MSGLKEASIFLCEWIEPIKFNSIYLGRQLTHLRSKYIIVQKGQRKYISYRSLNDIFFSDFVV